MRRLTMPGVTALFVIVGFICTLVAAAGKLPLWIPVLLAFVALLLQIYPR
jgi:hypothetical protein